MKKATGRAWWTCVLMLAVFPSLATAESAPRIAECRVGFDGTLKVGHWTPVWIDVAGDLGTAKASVELTTVDSDGVEVTVTTSAQTSKSTLLYTRSGRLGSGMRARLVADDGLVLDQMEISPATLQAGDAKFTSLPSTGTLVLQLGPGELGLPGVLADPGASDGAAVGAAVQIVNIEALPTDWFGYDAVDVLVLSTSDVDFCTRLAADTRRFEALNKWLMLGGRLVICAGSNAPRLLSEGAPLVAFAPGRFTGLVRLPQTQSLETFAASRDAVSRGGAQQILLPLLADIEGRVELFGRGNDLPILVRAARGFGELTFLGIDPTEEPFSDWTGRAGLLRAVLRPYLPAIDANTTKHKLVSLGYDDLSGALRQRLGRAFAGVSVLGFPLVAGLIIGYLLWLGPLDYLFVDRVARRSWIAWLTLPVIVLATSLGAALLASASKDAAGPQINQAELVDVDLSSNSIRGTCWSTLYSPHAERYNVTLEPQLPGGDLATNARVLASWLGLPGRGLGGMHAAGEPINVAGVGYRTPADLNELIGVPLLTAATKSFLSEWTNTEDVAASPPLTAELTLNDEGLLVGSITNNSGRVLDDACLLSGQTGYRLGSLEPGKQIAIGPNLSPLRTRSILARRTRRRAAGEEEAFLADRATPGQLLNVMMFYEALGGEGFAGLPNRYQSRCDLSRLLEFDRAILVANSPASGSRWSIADVAETPQDEQKSSTVIYRFIIPLTLAPATLNAQP